MICPVCKKRKANKSPVYGVLPCDNCKKRRQSNNLPDKQPDMCGESIKTERQSFGKSILQPYRDGVLSKEYLEAYGTKNIKPTDKEIKNSKYVWRDNYSSNFDLKKTR